MVQRHSCDTGKWKILCEREEPAKAKLGGERAAHGHHSTDCATKSATTIGNQ